MFTVGDKPKYSDDSAIDMLYNFFKHVESGELIRWFAQIRLQPFRSCAHTYGEYVDMPAEDTWRVKMVQPEDVDYAFLDEGIMILGF